MAGFETITSRAPTPGPQALPQLDDGSATAAGAVRVGQAVAGIGNALQEAQGAAAKARATTGYLTETAELDKRYENDQDPATAAQRYADEELKIRQKALGNVSDPTQRAQLETQLTRYGTSSQSQYRGQALRKQSDAVNADLDAQQPIALTKVSRAGSSTERAAITTSYNDQVDDAANKGWITRQAAQTRKSAFSRTVDDTDAVKAIAENPQAAAIALEDPQRFTSLTPQERQARLQQAQAAASTLFTEEAKNAARFDPARGMAMVGRVTDLRHMPAVIDKALIPQESSGNPDAVSPKGAAGLTQIMPDTARMIGKQMGIAIFDGQDDASVRATLKSRPLLARQMAVKHMGDLATRYEGRLGPAFAAYHAGSGNADKWHNSALEKFGPGYSVSDFISVIPDSVQDGTRDNPGKKTKDYVADMFRRLGADPARTPRLGQSAVFQAATAVGTELDSDLAAQKRVRDALASVARDDAGSITAAFKQGFAQDPQLVAQTRATLTQAAAGGDAASAKSLRELDYVERIAPAIKEAYNASPARLEAALASERARMAAAPHVTQEERERFDAMQTVAETVARERNTNPVGLLERSGAPVIAMPAQLAAPNMGEALNQRGQQAEIAAGRYGADIKPFKPQEVAAYKNGFDHANPDERFRFAETAARSMSDAAYEAAMTQLGADKLTIIAGRLAARDPALGQKVARGAALMKQAGVDDGKAADLKTALGRTLGGSVFPPAVQAEMIDASLAVYVADRDGKGALFDASDPKAMEQAIESVTGKLAKINGVKVPLPQGVPAARFEQAIGSLSIDDIGGQPTGRDGKPVDIEFLRAQGRLRPDGYGDGRYRVTLPGPNGQDAAVLDAKGKPLVIDLTPAIKRADAGWGASDRDQAVASGLIRGGLKRPDRPDWQDRAFPQPAERGPYGSAAGETARSIEIAEQRLADLLDEQDSYAKARAPSPESILGGQIRSRIERDLVATRAELERLRKAKP